MENLSLELPLLNLWTPLQLYLFITDHQYFQCSTPAGIFSDSTMESPELYIKYVQSYQ